MQSVCGCVREHGDGGGGGETTGLSFSLLFLVLL